MRLNQVDDCKKETTFNNLTFGQAFTTEEKTGNQTGLYIKTGISTAILFTKSSSTASSSDYVQGGWIVTAQDICDINYTRKGKK